MLQLCSQLWWRGSFPDTTINYNINKILKIFVDQVRVRIFLNHFARQRGGKNGSVQRRDNGSGNVIIRHAQTDGIFLLLSIFGTSLLAGRIKKYKGLASDF